MNHLRSRGYRTWNQWLILNRGMAAVLKPVVWFAAIDKLPLGSLRAGAETEYA